MRGIVALFVLSSLSGCACAADHVADAGHDADPFFRDADSHPSFDADPHSDVDWHFFDAHVEPPDAWRADVWPASEAVTVVVLASSGAPIPGTPVYFHDATGALVDTVPTDADGAAASGGPGIAAITVPAGPSPRPPTGPISVWGVAAGDTITVSAPVAPETVTFFHASSFGTSFVSAVDYAESPGVSVMLWDSRAMPAIFAFGGASPPDPAPYALLTGLPPGGPFVISGWRTDYDRVPVHVTSAPAGTLATAYAWLGSDVGRLGVAGGVTSVLDLPHAFAPGPGSYIEARAGLPPGIRSRDYARIVPYDTAAGPEGITVDLGTPQVIDAITFDHDTLDVSWGTSIDAYAIELTLGLSGTTWTIVAPGPATHLRPPEVPFMPRVDPSMVTQCGITFHREANYADYRAFRQHPLGPFDPLGWAGTRTWVWEQLP